MKDWLRPLPVFRALAIVMIVGYAFAIGFLLGRVTS